MYWYTMCCAPYGQEVGRRAAVVCGGGKLNGTAGQAPLAHAHAHAF